VRLGFVKKLDGELARRQLRQQRLEVLEVEDVIDYLDVAAGMRVRQVQQLRQRPRRRLAAIRHGRAVEAAEGAVHALAPPAAARGLDEDARLPAAGEPAAFEPGEEVGEVRI